VARYAQGLGIDEPLAIYRGGKSYYYHADGLGSIVALSDNHGTTKASYTYDAFGNNAPPSPPPTGSLRRFCSRRAINWKQKRKL